MKSQKKKKKSQEGVQTNCLPVLLGMEMPTADVVAAERASEAAYERELAALMLGEASDSGGSDGEARLCSALRPLRLLLAPARNSPPPAARPAAAVLPALAAALRGSVGAHPVDARFLDDYKFLLDNRTEAEVQAITEELMRSVETALSAGEGAAAAAAAGGGVVLASWLAAATAWRAPRVPGALPALHCLLQHLTSYQVSEVARALHAALEPRELVAASDAARGSELGARLARAALDGLLGLEPGGRADAPSAAEACGALRERWSALDASARLVGLALAGRATAGGAPREAGALLAGLAPPPPPLRDGPDPEHLKVTVAVKTLQNLFKDM